MSDTAVMDNAIDGTVNDVAEMDEGQFQEAYGDDDSFGSESPDAQDVAEEQVEEEAEPDQMAEIMSKLESLEKSNRDLQLQRDRMGNELGELRKLAPTKEEEKPMDPQEYLQKFADDPEGMQREIARQEVQRRDRVQAQMQQAVEANRNVVLSLDKDFESKVPAIKEWYKEKGASDEFISQLSTQALYQSPDLAVALGEVASLKAKLKEVSAKGPEMLKKINNTRSSTITSRNGKPTTQSVSAFQDDVSKMTKDELADFLKSTYI